MKLGIFKLLFAFLFISLSSHAKANASSDFYTLKIPAQIDRSKDGTEPVPWPFGTEIPFPWDDINGVWKVVSGSKEVYFSFRVLPPSDDGERQINIQQINPRSCAVTANGIGYEIDRVVRGVMNGRGLSYRISIRAFLDERASAVNGPTQVTVLSISSSDAEGKAYFFQMAKVSAQPFQCEKPSKSGSRR